jgi:hypothetical protein
MTKISQLTPIGANLAADDEFIIRDVSDASTPNKRVTSSGFIDYVISQGSVTGFTQIAAGVGPLARVQTITSGTTGTVITSTASAGTLVERTRTTPSGQFLVGTIAAIPAGAKLQTVDGITFPATQVASADPNTLDDYEEGTWTPVGISATGRYTKIGNIVTLYLGASENNNNNNTNPITGLPFSGSYPTNNTAGNGRYYALNNNGTTEMATGAALVVAGNLYLMPLITTLGAGAGARWFSVTVTYTTGY